MQQQTAKPLSWEQNDLQSSSSDLSYTDFLLGQLKALAKLRRISVKRSFISMVWPAIHTNPSIKNGAFRKRSSNQKVLKTLALYFNLDRKHFENRGRACR